MPWNSFRRAVRTGTSPGQRLAIGLLGAASAVSAVLLLLVFGQAAELILAGAAGNPECWVPRSLPELPHVPDGRYGLVALSVIAIVLACFEAVVAYAYYRAGQRAAVSTASHFRAAVFRHAFALRGIDLLGRMRSRPEELFSERCDLLCAGAVAWWCVVPRNLILAVSLILLALWGNFLLASATLLLVAIIVSANRRIKAVLTPDVGLARAQRSQQLDELARGLRYVPLAVDLELAEPPGIDVEATLGRYRRASMRAQAVRRIVSPLRFWMMACGAAFLVFLLGYNMMGETPKMSLADSCVAAVALLLAHFPASSASRLFRRGRPLYEAEAATEELFTFLAREPMTAEAANPVAIGPLRSAVSLKEVAVADSEGRRLLDDVSFDIPAGKNVALVSTDDRACLALAGLLVRFHDPAAGRIFFDGTDLRGAGLASLRRQTAVADADGMLFPGTVSENISCDGDRFSSLDVTNAAKQVHAYSFIQRLPQGFSTYVEPDGNRLDTDEAFRLGLARAVLRGPSLLVVREPAEPATPEASRHLDEALRRVAAERTLVVLARRLSTLREADHVLLLHEGRLLGDGTHNALIESCELYRHLLYMRFNPFGFGVE